MFFRKFFGKIREEKKEEKILYRPLVVKTWAIENPRFQCGIQYWKDGFRIGEGRVLYPTLPSTVEGEVSYSLDNGDWQDHLSVHFKERGGFETSFSFWTGEWDPSESELFERFLKEFARSIKAAS